MESKKIAIIAGSVFMVILLLGINGFSVKGRRPEYPQYLHQTKPSFQKNHCQQIQYLLWYLPK